MIKPHISYNHHHGATGGGNRKVLLLGIDQIARYALNKIKISFICQVGCGRGEERTTTGSCRRNTQQRRWWIWTRWSKAKQFPGKGIHFFILFMQIFVAYWILNAKS